MIEVKQGTLVRVPVRLFTGTTPVSAVPNTGITVMIIKADATSLSYTPTAANWAIYDTGIASGTGTYQLRLQTTDVDIPGTLMYLVKSATSDTFVGSVKVVANEEADTFSRVTDMHDETFGKWRIFTTGPDANRLVMYRPDGVTVLKKFDLKTASGAPTVVNPFIRDPLP